MARPIKTSAIEKIKPKGRDKDPITGKPRSYYHQFTATLANGERKRISIVRAEEQDVIDEYNRLRTDEIQGKLLEKKKVTVGEWMRQWMDNYKRLELETTTINNYNYAINNHIIPHIGKTELQKLTTNDVQKMIAKIRRTHKPRPKNSKHTQSPKPSSPYSPGTCRLVHMVLSQALDQAHKEDIVLKNVADYAKIPKQVKTDVRQKVLSEDDLKKVIKVAHDEHMMERKSNKCLYPALLLMIETGVRIGELLGMLWDNLNFDNNQVLIKDTVYDDKGKIKTKKKPKNYSSIRWLPLSEKLMNILGSMERTCEFVFPSKAKTPIRPNNFLRAFKRWCSNAGVGEHSPHDLRHTFITDMVNSGESITTIQSFTGHANATTLLNVYAHKVTEEKLNAAKRKQKRMQKFYEIKPEAKPKETKGQK